MCSTYHHTYNWSTSWTDYVDDYHGLPFTDSSFYVRKDYYDPPRLNGKGNTSSFACVNRINAVPSLWASPGYTGYTNARASLPSYDSDTPSAGVFTEAIARSNPSRPIVNLPQLVFELRELPGLIRWTGERLLGRKASGAYLAWTFGAAPLISDLVKLWNFADHANRRLEQLRRLFNGGLRRRVNLGVTNLSSGSYGPGIVDLPGGTNVVNGSVQWVTTRNRWAVVRWEPDDPGLPRTPEWYADKVMETALGGLDLALIWELTPWSWLVDWFTSVGDFLSATSNAVGAHPSRVNVMTHSKVELSYTVTSKPSWVTVSNQSAKTRFERKRRTVSLTPGVLDASLPFLTGKQLGILGALTIQKVPRSLLRAAG